MRDSCASAPPATRMSRFNSGLLSANTRRFLSASRPAFPTPFNSSFLRRTVRSSQPFPASHPRIGTALTTERQMCYSPWKPSSVGRPRLSPPRHSAVRGLHPLHMGQLLRNNASHPWDDGHKGACRPGGPHPPFSFPRAVSAILPKDCHILPHRLRGMSASPLDRRSHNELD